MANPLNIESRDVLRVEKSEVETKAPVSLQISVVLCDTWNWNHDNDAFRHLFCANSTICKNLLYCDFISALQCAVVANSRVVQAARYRYLTILTVFFAISWHRDILWPWRYSLLVSPRLISRYRWYRTTLDLKANELPKSSLLCATSCCVVNKLNVKRCNSANCHLIGD